ncbi:MAG: PIG-L family deacetylase [Acidobacteriota bacterium]
MAVAASLFPLGAQEARGRTETQKLRIVVFGGHPDDPETGAGGLIALLARGGHEVIVAYGTSFRGDRKFFDQPETVVRQREAAAACKILGATPKFFPYAHEKLAADAETQQAVSSWLAEARPDIVVTHWPALDEEPLLKAAREPGGIITAEEHSIIGGLGEAVAGFLCGVAPALVRRIGVRDVFGESGHGQELLDLYGLRAANIADEAMCLLVAAGA